MRNVHESARKGLEWPRGCGGSTWQHGGLAAVDEIRANAGHGQRASDPHDYRRLRNSRRSRHSEPYLTKSEVRLRRPKVTPQFDKQGVRRVHTTPEYAGSRSYSCGLKTTTTSRCFPATVRWVLQARTVAPLDNRTSARCPAASESRARDRNRLA